MNKNTDYIFPILIVLLILAGSRIELNAQGPSALNQSLAAARAATAKYHDLSTAMEDGYTLLPPGVCHETAIGAVGVSYINIPRFVAAVVNEDEPEFLNYIPTGDGNMRLVSVAYGSRVLFRDTRPPETPGYRPGVFPWLSPTIPIYLEEVSGTFSVFGQQPHRLFEGRWIYLTTVSLWADNPAGMFADGNPNLSCS